MAGRIIRFLAVIGMRQKTSSLRVMPLSDAAVGELVATPPHITSPYVFWHHDGKRHSAFANSSS